MTAGRPRRASPVGHAPARLDAALLTQVEAWRRQQPGRLSQKAAVERLLLRGLRAERDDETLGMTCGDPDEFLPKEPTR